MSSPGMLPTSFKTGSPIGLALKGFSPHFHKKHTMPHLAFLKCCSGGQAQFSCSPDKHFTNRTVSPAPHPAPNPSSSAPGKILETSILRIHFPVVYSAYELSKALEGLPCCLPSTTGRQNSAALFCLPGQPHLKARIGLCPSSRLRSEYPVT